VQANTTVDERDDGRFWATLKLSTPSGTGTREVDARTCDELTDGVAIVISLAIDTWLEELERAPQPEPEPQPEAEPQPKPQPKPPVAMAPPPLAPTGGGFVRLRTGLSYGALPRVGAGLGAAIGVRDRHWRLGLTGDYWLRRRARLDDDPNAGVNVSLWTLGVRAGGVPDYRRLEFPVEGGVELGAVTGRGVGLETQTAARRLWVAGVGSAGIAFLPMDWLAVGFTLEAAVPFVRPGFSVEPVGTVHEVGPVGLRAFASAELRLPSL
jgi:hypothetical protein